MTFSPTALNRRQFLKLSSGSTAALILGFTWLPGKSQEIVPGQTIFSPNAYLSIDVNDTITVVMPRSEMGQNIYTSLPMIIAEELEADWSKIKVTQGDLDQVYGSQTTGGSASIRTQYDLLRKAGATARKMLVQAAAQKWDVSVETCYAREGFVYHKAIEE